MRSCVLVLALVMVVVNEAVVNKAPTGPCSTCGQHQHHLHLPGVVVTGALAYAGSYAGTHSFGSGQSQDCPSCGCGGCGTDCGWCGGGYGRRNRRSLQGFLEDVEIQDTYNKIAAEDKDQCGLRLVCELAQRDPRTLAEDEIQILTPYHGAGKSDGTIYGDYDEAAWHGQEGHSCPDNYPLCAFTANQVMDEYRKDSQEHPDDGDK